jgi:dihydropteroate synthase
MKSIHNGCQLVGILNLTPDSFSDGGKYDHAEAAYAHAQQLIKDGAHIIDIGAESTRPHATPLTPAQEWQRLSPILSDIIKLAHSNSVLVSLDSRHPETIARALGMGIDWVNDVSGFHPAMLDVVKHSDAACVAMHSLTIPANPAITLPDDCDILATLKTWGEQTTARLEAGDIARHRIILDPGLGFGKTATQSWHIIEHTNAIRAEGIPLLIGHSRKSFLKTLPNLSETRDAETLAVSGQLAAQGVEYLRVHNIAQHQTR